jgi:hypothetical protein
MWLSMLLFFTFLISIPLSVLLIKNRKGLFVAIAQAAVPIIIGGAGFLKIYHDVIDALPNVPVAQQAASKESGIQIAYAALQLTGLQAIVLFLLTMIVYGIACTIRNKQKKV